MRTPLHPGRYVMLFKKKYEAIMLLKGIAKKTSKQVVSTIRNLKGRMFTLFIGETDSLKL